MPEEADEIPATIPPEPGAAESTGLAASGGPSAGAAAAGSPRKPASFSEDFRLFFVRGLAALLPTLITISLIGWLWNFLWTSIGQYVTFGIRRIWLALSDAGVLEPTSAGDINHRLNDNDLKVRLLGVGLAILLVYVVGILVGNLIGRWFYRLAERAVMKVPLIRAIYPAVKQVTDFILADKKKANQFAGSRVVAVQARAQGIWSIGFVTGGGYGPINNATKGDMITVFIPSTPTAFAGYVVVAHREATVDLPLTVEETMRLLVSGGVIIPQGKQHAATAGATSGAAGGPAGADVRPAGMDWPVEALPPGAVYVGSPQERARLVHGGVSAAKRTDLEAGSSGG